MTTSRAPDYARILSQIESETPFQAPTEITSEQLESDPGLTDQILKQAYRDLEGMNGRICAFAHEHSWRDSGYSVELCSDVLRANSIHCGHGLRLPIVGVIKTLTRFGFVSSDESDVMLKMADGKALNLADAAAYDVANILGGNPSTDIAKHAERLERYKFDVPVEEITVDNADQVLARLQVSAGKEIRTIRDLLLSGLKAAEEDKGGFAEKRAAFRSVLTQGMAALGSPTT